MNRRQSLCSAFFAFAALTGAATFSDTAGASDATVFAAASLKTALDEVATRFAGETGKSVTISYAGTPALARQIEQGAPADVFFSADTDWMDYLERRELIDSASRVTLLSNALVMIAPQDSIASVRIAPGMDIVSLLGKDGRLAIADVDSVPAGLYGKASLTNLDIWQSIADRIVETDNVRSALAFVARGEAPLGIVYATDAAVEPRVKILGTFPTYSHPPIRYPVALTVDSTSAEAAEFLEFLRSGSARAVFEGQGFEVLDQSSQS